MSSTTDPSGPEAARRGEDVTESLRARVEELGRRFKDVSTKADIEARIAAYPVSAVAFAFALGALAGVRRWPSAPDVPRRSLGGALVAGIGAVTLRFVKNYALEQMSGAARSWLDDRQRSVRTEPGAARATAGETFSEH